MMKSREEDTLSIQGILFFFISGYESETFCV